MSRIMHEVMNTAKSFNRNLEHIPFPDIIEVAEGVLPLAADFAAKHYHSILLVADQTTYQIAGRALHDNLLAQSLDCKVTLVTANAVGDIVADEASVVQVLLDIQQIQADVVLAVGSGTIHDIVRYAAFTSSIAFISIPTAPSVDGFTSKGAPLIIRGDKITVPAVGPVAIFADLGILAAAPTAMIAAGFADMLGKSTSLFDWKFGCLTGGETADPLVELLTRQSLDACIAHIDRIGRREPEGIAVLTDALIQSGLAMLIFGQSHSASGGEHHLSHYWEMEFLRSGKRQLLHGAKVGVACTLITELYQSIGESGLPSGSLSLDVGVNARDHWDTVRAELAALPDKEQLTSWLRAVGGPATIEELGISPELKQQAFAHAHLVRPNRQTLLKLYNLSQP